VGLNPSFWELIGYPSVTQENQVFFWPPNKYGLACVNPMWMPRNWDSPCDSWGGMAIDDGEVSGRIPNLMYGGGDAHWQDNSIYRFYFGADSPYWDCAVLGCHADDAKTGHPRSAGEPCNRTWECDPYDLETYPEDDPNFWRMYDGSPRGGHDYWDKWYCKSRDWMMQVTRKQLYPVDAGYAQEASAADLSAPDATGYPRWMRGSATPDWTMYPKGAEIAWGSGDPATGDFYKLLGGRLLRWNSVPNTWQECWQWGGQPWSWDGATGSVNYTDGYVLMASGYHAADAGSPADSVIWWKVRLSDIPMGRVTPADFIANQKITATGTYADLYDYQTSLGSYYTFIWVPEMRSFLSFMADGEVYTITPNSMDPDSVSIEKLPIPEAVGSSSPGINFMGTGGVWSNFMYVPSMKICIVRPRDNTNDMKAFRIG